ncbi:MAG: metallophosphoesterase [Coriobacteriia bacterium]
MADSASAHRDATVIAHISDLHCGSRFHVPNLAMRVVAEINELEPDVVVVTGDLTDMGFREDFEAAARIIGHIECPHVVVLPGNHDARNVGEVHFEALFGERDSELVHNGVHLLGIDSSEPDLDNGRVGRERHRWIEKRFTDPDEFKVVCLHHHLVPVPGTGRERNIASDAGDVLRVLSSAGADLVLCGHKHVPNVWRLEDLLVVNAGTACTHRLRGNTRPSYNVVEVRPDSVRILLKKPFDDPEVVADYARAGHVCSWGPREAEA